MYTVFTVRPPCSVVALPIVPDAACALAALRLSPCVFALPNNTLPIVTDSTVSNVGLTDRHLTHQTKLDAQRSKKKKGPTQCWDVERHEHAGRLARGHGKTDGQAQGTGVSQGIHTEQMFLGGSDLRRSAPKTS